MEVRGHIYDAPGPFLGFSKMMCILWASPPAPNHHHAGYHKPPSGNLGYGLV